ncbi:alpha/beta hydrolase [Aquimarina litoralis]|uniref:alpha/beta hydrolase n=1 Tax=Aquimarina litoralis TaxID=584605 RepID=UPI001C5A45E0|nr:alpha/beta fold hydrolase [Aquimarina litoralis]MBW1294246.1 alpha/beta fold hydrolase [Aquimarina litoralis]
MLKKITLISLLIIHSAVINAQMDDKFYFPKKELQPIEWKNIEELSFKIEKDTISALILKPKEKPKATIFYFHGAGGNISYYVPLTKILVEDNFQVVMIDFRGYGKSTGIPTHKNINKDGTLILEDLLEKEGIKETPKIIYGISIGTQIGTLLAKTYKEQINGLVLEGTMASFTDIAMYHVPEYKEYLEKNYISPYAAKEDIKNLDKTPKLFIHSKEDKDVPFSQGKMVYDNASGPKKFIEFKGKHLHGLKHKKELILKEINQMLH